MKAEDVTDTLNLALAASGCDRTPVSSAAASALRQRTVLRRRPNWPNGSQDRDIDHIHGAPSHPQTQGKIERWHQTLKNRILLENYFLPGDLEAQIAAFVEHYNHRAITRASTISPRRRLLRTRPNHPVATRKDQAKDHRTAALAASQSRRLK